MSTTDIPLKVRVDIRDLWDSPNSPIHKLVEDLTKTLGPKVLPVAQWPSLWIELGGRFPDKATFVPAILSATTVWYERLLARVDDNEDWAEELLTALNEAEPGGTFDLRVEPAPPKVNRPSTTWDSKLGVFHLVIPNVEPMSQGQIAGFLEKDLENLLAPGGAAEDIDWAEVPSAAAPASASRGAPQAHPLQRGPAVAEPASVAPPAPQRLPTLVDLPRPKDLLPATPPYILTVTSSGREGLVVQCSHEPSLELLHEYLKKWGKINPNDSMRRTVFKLTLVESDFCVGMMDSLYIEPTMTYHRAMNPTIVLSFIEGVLGYKMVHTNGSYWMYRCTTLFKR